MQFGRIIISLSLLLTYSMGFAHNLVPHHEETMEQHVVAEASNEHHGHAHHEHPLAIDLVDSHEHISHNNHFDSDVYDLIVCFFNETAHPTSACNIEHFPNSKSASDSKVKNGNSVISMIDDKSVQVAYIEIVMPFGNTSTIPYSNPPITQSPHRGPPLS